MVEIGQPKEGQRKLKGSKACNLPTSNDTTTTPTTTYYNINLIGDSHFVSLVFLVFKIGVFRSNFSVH